jgi:hypothetical protein
MAMTREKTAGRRGLAAAGGIVIAVAALALIGYNLVFPYAVGPRQPLPFSHHIHAGVREISCLYCHDGADRSPVAGIPAVAKCELCHRVIIRDFPEIRQLRGYYERSEPIPWVRVNLLPDYGHFSHEMHLAKGIDCGQCHGDVKAMDRILPSYFHMGFCIDCHRQNNASVDCVICHY